MKINLRQRLVSLVMSAPDDGSLNCRGNWLRASPFFDYNVRIIFVAHKSNPVMFDSHTFGTYAALNNKRMLRAPVMKQLTLIVRPITAEAVLKVIGQLDVNACLVQEAKGYSRQKGYLERYRGSEYSMAFLPKVEISVWVSDQRVQEVEDKITKVARTGRIGDGKVFVVDVGWPGAMEF
jgi:nitrogen regulatory protein P-II 2